MKTHIPDSKITKILGIITIAILIIAALLFSSCYHDIYSYRNDYMTVSFMRALVMEENNYERACKDSIRIYYHTYTIPSFNEEPQIFKDAEYQGTINRTLDSINMKDFFDYLEAIYF